MKNQPFKKPLQLIAIGATLVVIGLIFKAAQLGWGILQANTIVIVGAFIEIIAAIYALAILIKNRN